MSFNFQPRKVLALIIILIIILFIIRLNTPGDLPPDLYKELKVAVTSQYGDVGYFIKDVQRGKDSSKRYGECWCLLVEIRMSPTTSSTVHYVAAQKGTSWVVLRNIVDLGLIFYQFGCEPRY